MATEYPAPEQRVRDYLDARAERDADADWIAYCPIGGSDHDLTVTDLRDVLAELEAARAIAEEVDRLGGLDAIRRGQITRPLDTKER